MTHVFGGYWDVYRMAFLSGKRVVAFLPDVPQPVSRMVARSGAGPRKAAGSAARARGEMPAVRPPRRGGRDRDVRSAIADRLAAGLRDGLESGWADPAELIVFGSSFLNPSQRGDSRVQRGNVQRTMFVRAVRAASLGPGRPGGAPGLDGSRSPASSGTPSASRALFYFDITEINYPYRAFFAEELRAGRFSRWCPGLYCGMPLYSESQAGYLHPLKYLFYPWLETWKAFNLDTVLSVWLTGVGTYLLAAPACRAGGALDRGGGLRPERVTSGPT